MSEDSKLMALLMQVPIRLLSEALRARKRELWKVPLMNQQDQAVWLDALDSITKKTGFQADEICSGSKDHDLMKARWDLYERLHLKGWDVYKIYKASGHDHTRIKNGLRKRGLIPKSKSS